MVAVMPYGCCSNSNLHGYLRDAVIAIMTGAAVAAVVSECSFEIAADAERTSGCCSLRKESPTRRRRLA